jgi:DNA repair protein RecO (recombination protein O)
MRSKNKCIVLSKLKYKDYDLIVRCYTSERGLVSYLLRGALKSKKNNAKAIYFQPLSQLSIEEHYKASQSLHSIKEVKPLYLFKTLHTHVYKSAIVMFLAEVLTSALKEEEANSELFMFIETALQYLDNESHFANFHLLFLLKLTRYLGFLPQKSTVNSTWFNLKSGLFESEKRDVYAISGENVVLLKTLLGINFDALTTVKINSNQRRAFLDMVLHYFELHLDGFKKPKSLQVLNAVFH